MRSSAFAPPPRTTANNELTEAADDAPPEPVKVEVPAAPAKPAPAKAAAEKPAANAALAKKVDARSFARPSAAVDDRGAIDRLARSKQPIGQANLTDLLRATLVRSLPRAFAGVVQEQVHPGFGKNPFDFAALAREKNPAVHAALAAYLGADFAFVSPEQKKAVLDKLRPVLLPNMAEALARFHLPQRFSEASGKRPVTLAIEAEAGIKGRPQTLDYYAPDPDGLLDERLMTPAFVAGLEKKGLLTKRPPAWHRLSAAQRAELVRWKDLTYDGRMLYLSRMKASIDPKVTLHRIENIKAAPKGVLAPATLCDQIKWEVSGPLVTAELITKTHYTSRDQLARDEHFIASIGGKPPGFHYHCVLELDSKEDKQTLGPKLAGLAAMTDLFLFAHDVRSGCKMLDHTHLEVFKADGVLEVMDAFSGDEIDSDEIMVHKYHLVGVRHGEAMYGNKNRLGLEIRAVPTGRSKMGQEVVARTLDIATSAALKEVDTDFWLEWNAGDKKLPKAAYERARAACQDRALAAGAQLTFEELFEYAMDGRKAKDHFRLAAPLWNYDALPGITDAEKARIASARARFETRLLEASQALSRAIESGRELAPSAIFDELQRHVFTFFAEAKVDDVIKRHLDGLAEKGRS